MRKGWLPLWLAILSENFIVDVQLGLGRAEMVVSKIQALPRQEFVGFPGCLRRAERQIVQHKAVAALCLRYHRGRTFDTGKSSVVLCKVATELSSIATRRCKRQRKLPSRSGNHPAGVNPPDLAGLALARSLRSFHSPSVRPFFFAVFLIL